MLGCGHGGVVGRTHHERRQQVTQANRLPRHQTHLGLPHPGRPLADRDPLVQVTVLEDHQGSHHLGGGGHGPSVVRGPLAQDQARIGVVEDPGGSRDRRGVRLDQPALAGRGRDLEGSGRGGRHGPQEHHCHQQCGDELVRSHSWRRERT